MIMKGCIVFCGPIFLLPKKIRETERKTNSKQYTVHMGMHIHTYGMQVCKWKYTNWTNTDLYYFYSELWVDCIRPSVTYGLCMPFAFRMIAERTSDEFSIRAARWESRLAFLRSASKAQVSRVPPPYVLSQWLVNQRMWQKNFKIVLLNLSLLHGCPWGKSRTCQNGKRSELLLQSHQDNWSALSFCHASLWLHRNWPMTNEAY